MIQPAAPSVSITLAPGPGAPAPAGDETAVSLGFAALLETSTAAGKAQKADVSEAPALAITPANLTATRQSAGKLAGKKVPGASPDTPQKKAPKSDQSDIHEPAPVVPAAREGIPAIADIMLPGLIVPGSPAEAPKAPSTPEAPPSPAPERSTAKTLLMTSAAAPPLPSALPAQAQATERQPPQPKAAQSTTTAPPQATPVQAAQLLATPLPAPAATVATRGEVAAAPAAAPVPAQPMTPESLPAASPAPAADRSLPAAVEPAATPRAPTAEAISPVPRPAVPAAAPLPLVAKTAAADPVQSESTPAPSGGDVVQVTIRRVAAPAAPAVQPTATVLQASGRVAAPARTAAKPEVQPEASSARPIAAKPDDRPAAQLLPEAMAQADASKARPAIAAQGFSADSRKPEPAQRAEQQQQLSLAAPQPSLETGAIVPAAEPKTAASGIQSGHDFAELVDRLVEAREAASPDTVRAAISHSEFGQVSLRFEQDANGLSVSMTSADPDFAGAVQASAASAQAQTQADGGSHQRQDSQSQQQSQAQAHADGQGFAQTHSQSSARDERAHQNPQQPPAAEARFGRPSSQQRQDDGSADSRGGIYA